MSPTDHRAEALDALALIQASDNPFAEMSSASEATAHALLAIEQRLGELVEHQRMANTISALHHIGCYDGHEYIAARATVRRVLGLPPEGQNR